MAIANTTLWVDCETIVRIRYILKELTEREQRKSGITGRRTC